MDLLRAWSTAIFKGIDYLSPCELDELRKSNLPITAEELKNIAHLSADDIYKAIEPTKTPKGPPGAKNGSEDTKVGNTRGLPKVSKDANGQAKTVASADAATVRKDTGESASDIYYVSKRDYPKRPNGCIGETPHSWKVPFGVNVDPQAENQKEKGDGEEDPASSVDPTAYSKLPKDRNILEAHLTSGKIVDVAPLGVSGATDSSKIVIYGNGAGIMKPNAECLYEQKIVVSKKEPTNKAGWEYNKDDKTWSRVEAKEYPMYDPTSIGTFGSGNVPYRRNVQREVAAYRVANLLGISAVPMTVQRTHEGKPHSVQDFKPGCKDIYSYIQQDANSRGVRMSHKEMFQKYAGDQWEEMSQKLKDFAVFDAIINNQDRHSLNLLVDGDKKEVYLIDHGFSFGNSMHGSRNFFMHHMFHGNEKIQMSDRLKKSILNKSFTDFQKAMPDMYDWEAGQCFLRSRYMVWMQATNGSIDKKKFLHVQSRNDGKGMAVGDNASWSFVGTSKARQASELLLRKASMELPYQVFDRWAKGYIEHAASLPSHPDHEDCKRLKDIGVFMESGFCAHPGGTKAYRDAGLHREYEDSLEADMDVKFEEDDFQDDSMFGENPTVAGEPVASTRKAAEKGTRKAK